MVVDLVNEGPQVLIMHTDPPGLITTKTIDYLRMVLYDPPLEVVLLGF